MKTEEIMKILLFIVLLIGSIDDLKNRYIHVTYVYVFFAGALMQQIFCPEMGWKSFLGGIAFGLALYVMTLWYEGIMGSGDAFMLGLCGSYLGIINTLVLFFRAVICAAFFGTLVTAGKIIGAERIEEKIELPFVPFLLCSYLTIVLQG